MKSTFDIKVSDEPLHNFNEEETFGLVKKLKVEINATPFNILNCN